MLVIQFRNYSAFAEATSVLSAFDAVTFVPFLITCSLYFPGPAAAKVLATGAPDIDMEGMFFMNNKLTSVFGIGNCRVSRCGYTGEDGFEVGAAFAC